MGIGDEVTTFAAALYFAVRVAHYVIYTFAVPVVRTVVFLIGFGCQMVFAGRLLGWW
jgi:uncharacterized MAPEG superfamily protein